MAVRYAQTIEIDRPAQEVFDYLAHAENMPRWMASFRRVRQVSEGPPAKGTRYEFEHARANGSFEWTEFDPSRRLAWHGQASRINPRGGYTLEPAGAGTRLHVVMEPELRGPLKLAAPLVQRTFARETPRDLEALKRLLEAGDPAASV